MWGHMGVMNYQQEATLLSKLGGREQIKGLVMSPNSSAPGWEPGLMWGSCGHLRESTLGKLS